MKVTAELSLYPLTTDYEQSIIAFIKHLKSYDDLNVNTHAMSTFVKGDIHKVMKAIAESMDHSAGAIGSSLVIKLINRDLPVEAGFLDF